MITIEVTSYNAHPLSPPQHADFGEAGGTIGRSPDSTLVLLDPDRKISRTHAMVKMEAGAFVIRDQGSVVPVTINGQPLGNGNEAPIGAGDEIRIGGYVMSVRVSAAAIAGTPPPVAVAPAAEAPAPAAPALEQAALQAQAAPVSEAPAVPVQAAPVSEAPAVPVQAAPAAEAPPAPPESVMAPVLSWDSAAAALPEDHVTTVILSGSAHPDHAASAAPEDTSAPAPEPPSAAAAQPSPPAAVATGDDLMRALLTGAGLPAMEIPGGLTPKLMHQLGQILREATGGMLDLLAARANTKRQVRADMTVIVAADNNPLKFSPGMEAALSHMLVPRGRGFMAPLRAVDDAYEDLRAHQLGFMAGMRSALTVVLSRFDPKQLEHRLSQSSVVDSLLPMHRKAKLWDLFGEHYAIIAKEAESDLHTLFGQEFLKAYQAKAARLPARADPSIRH